ncbi:GNAT family N-acetyltransferase [Allocoprobacillus halotolerans]|uniref:GNAT family N-acetyltransferase n=1 Tax=Allocoprobacillus halotolerans TaxID=2944914 RepID=A0ABY5I368_9FIRM|nr:GNAT family N-acetyltransferase [Allocoprobacillus halotolerans]UTY39803.1 GNAT family N-acetyltransferase [Allocoprobacillus halotolerans]
MSVNIKVATLEDAQDILNIYAPYVQTTNITFEYDEPTLQEMTNRIKNTLERYPYLVAMVDQKVVGYAYASPFASRAAYQWGSELSIYLDAHYHGRAIGQKLYQSMLALLKAMHIQHVYACITHPNIKSEKFHETFDFTYIGCFHHAGFKFNQWHDVIWMEKTIGDEENVQPVIPFPSLSREQIESCLGLCYDK